MSTYRDRVVAYITKGDRLLVFRHLDYPEAGVQVPAGHPEEGEELDDAVIRESIEETGLEGFEFVEYLGYREYDFSDKGIELELRHFYHLRYHGEPGEKWIHCELDPSDDTPPPICLEFSWVPVSEAKLDWDHDAMLFMLLQ